MAIAQDIVRAALKKAGVIGEGETPSAEQLTDALRDLNGLISRWNTKRWMIFDLVDLTFPADGRVTPYTVGPGGNYPISRRPDRIEAAYLRQFVNGSGAGLPVDTQLSVWAAREQYALATLKKNFVSYPSGVFLDPKWPLADLYVYPWPNAGNQYEVHLIFKNVLPILLANTNTDSFPSHYIPCMEFNLALLLRQANGKLQEDPQLVKQAMDTLSTVQDSNLAIPEMQVPYAYGGGIYNIYSDNNG